jgi:selenocysteine-specific elongation factor
VAALHRELAVPADVRLFADVLQAAGLDVVDGRVVHRGSVPRPDRLPPAVHELVDRLEREPFAAPERDELRSLGLGRREPAAARAGLLIVVSGDIVLLPTAPARATSALRGLAQPFTTSAAREALGTTRRVVIPLLEHLDATGATMRLDNTRRRLT